ISLPINPYWSQTNRMSRKTEMILSSQRLIKLATVVKCGRLSPLRAIKTTLFSHSAAILWLLITPRE
ncbi:MAG: hypothetical protein PVF97_08910, partial [Desulfobacterales bacterium]